MIFVLHIGLLFVQKLMTYAILDLCNCRILYMCQSGWTVGFLGLGYPMPKLLDFLMVFFGGLDLCINSECSATPWLLHPL